MLTAEAADLLLAVLESEQPMLNGAAAEFSPGPVALLEAAGLLVSHGHETMSASGADDDDALVSLIRKDDAGAMAFLSPASGLVTVPRHRLQLRRVEMSRLFAAVSDQLGMPRAQDPKSLADGFLWEVGGARIGKRPARVPVWFARRMWDPAVRQKVIDALAARPHGQAIVILCSCPARRVSGVAVPGGVLVPIRDVTISDATLTVSADILDARLRGVAVPAEGPLVLSSDNTLLTINGRLHFEFKSQPMMNAIRLLVDAYRNGKRVPIGDLTHHGSPQRLFGRDRWAQLKPYLKSVNGLWGFDL
ncbi:MAG: hypothetical protein NT133_14450 [Alphaproteobacteria bacterium]|nr:hypothetical protein [Alphaproteobacteria bacterium]